jgi:hypothetical protein
MFLEFCACVVDVIDRGLRLCGGVCFGLVVCFGWLVFVVLLFGGFIGGLLGGACETFLRKAARAICVLQIARTRA